MNIEELHKIFLESSGVSTDSRTFEENQLFFALKGENFDAHKFADEISRMSPAGIVIDDKSYSHIPGTIFVEDTLKCLQDLAYHHRQTFSCPVIGLTGSNGKTTTKELLVEALRTKYDVHATAGNFNNHIGVPLTILAATRNVEIIIVEMGANHIGEIAELCQIASPTHGLITNIGHAHIEGFGSFEGVITAKTELYKYLASRKGTIFYNPNDEILSQHHPEEAISITYNDDIEMIKHQSMSLMFKSVELDAVYHSSLFGDFNFSNVLAAYSVADYFDCNKEQVLTAISQYEPKINRSQLKQVGTTQFILDAYNANPTSMKSSLESFSHIQSEKNKAVILGDMGELGDNEVEFHKEILELLDFLPADHVVLVGPIFSEADSQNQFKHFEDVDDLISELEDIRPFLNNAICLIKASRSMKLEKIVQEV